MSFFEKIVFKTFLILALICFCLGSAFADTTYKYYSHNATNTCFTDPDSSCSKHTSYLNSQYSDTVFSVESCNLWGTTIDIKYSKVVQEMRGNPPVKTPVSYPSDGAYRPIGSEMSKVCKDGEKFELDGCTGKCVLDPCKGLKDQPFSKTVECGTATCPNGGVIVDNGTYSCSKGAALWLPRPLQSTSDGSTSCVGTLVNSFVPTSAQVKSSSLGSSSTTTYCSANYIYDGTSGSMTPSENNLISMSFSSVSETTEDGQCPSGTKKGSYAIGENGATKWVCVPDSGSPTDPTDPPPIDCAVGTHYDATTDKCVADTPPPDSDGDGTPDSEDDTPNGGGGGSNCNAQTGLGCNNPNPDSDTDGDGIPDKDDPMTDSDGDGDADKGDYYSDNCEKTPNCTADPVQCAILRNQWKANCEANRPLSQGEKDLVSSALSKQETENATASSEFSNKVNQIINDNALFSTSTSTTVACIPDKQIHIVGNASITVKYSLLCPYFSLLRNMLILVAYMFAARIVYAEVTGGGIRV